MSKEAPGKMMLLKDADWLDSYGRDLVEEGDADLEATGMRLERIAERIRAYLAAHDTESADSQIDRLANFIMAEVPGEPSQSEGAIDTAIRWMRSALSLAEGSKP